MSSERCVYQPTLHIIYTLLGTTISTLRTHIYLYLTSPRLAHTFETEKRRSKIISSTSGRERRHAQRTKTPGGRPRGKNTSSETSHALCTSLWAIRKCVSHHWTLRTLKCSRTSLPPPVTTTTTSTLSVTPALISAKHSHTHT